MAVDYSNKNVADRILLVGELEHIRRHAERSEVSPNISEDDRVWYAVVAKRARDLRRAYMEKYFPGVPDEIWCLGKSSASLRQLSYETDEGDFDTTKEIDELVDLIWGKITNLDLSGCKACAEDKNKEE